jgi:hypothetical protein
MVDPSGMTGQSMHPATDARGAAWLAATGVFVARLAPAASSIAVEPWLWPVVPFVAGVFVGLTVGGSDNQSYDNSHVVSETPTETTPTPAADDSSLEHTPDTHPEEFNPVRGSRGKKNTKTGEIWEKDMLHRDHYEVYKNKKNYEKGVRDRDVWADGRPKGTK